MAHTTCCLNQGVTYKSCNEKCEYIILSNLTEILDDVSNYTNYDECIYDCDHSERMSIIITVSVIGGIIYQTT